MKYNQLPKVRPKRGTSAKRRRFIARITESIFRKHAPQINEAIEKAVMDQVLFGQGFVRTIWGEDDISVQHVPYEEATK